MADRSQNPHKLNPAEIQSLKPKAKSYDRATIRVGGKKFEVPMTAFLLSTREGGNFSYLHIPHSLHLLLEGSEPLAVHKRSEAISALRKAGTKPKAAKPKETPATLPPDVLEAIVKAIPKGYKLGVDAAGMPKLVKARPRRSAQ